MERLQACFALVVVAGVLPVPATAQVPEPGGNRDEAVVQPVTKPWGQVVGWVVDANGILVEIATPMVP